MTKTWKVQIPNWAERVDQGWADNVREITPIQLAGIAFDLLNLRPEVCAVIEVVTNGTEVPNWEIKKGSPPGAWPLQAAGRLKPPQIVQGGPRFSWWPRPASSAPSEGDRSKSDRP